MLASQRAFLSGILDYAGLFPPAQLPLDAALGDYLRYRGEPEAWLLARFICPAGRLHELGPYVDGSPLRLSALLRGCDLDSVRSDLEAVAQARDALGPAAELECLEMPLPTGGPDRPEPLLALVAAAFEAQGLGALPRFYELPASADWRRFAGALSPRHEGLKLRCGGVDPAAIPSVTQVVNAVGACLAAQVPVKFTAGLHHPLRRRDPALGVYTHGFLNLFAAGILGACRGLRYDDLRAVVEEVDAHQFTFADECFAWRNVPVPVGEIADARRRHVISFGSCSFDEPRAGLRELGYI